MKKFLCSILTLAVLLTAALAVAGGYTAGTNMTDANFRQLDQTGLDTSKTISATVTGTKVAFSNQTLATATSRLYINCVNPTTGAASAARMKINNAGTEIPLNGMSPQFLIPSSVTSLAFTKYSTATATDSVKCTAFGH